MGVRLLRGIRGGDVLDGIDAMSFTKTTMTIRDYYLHIIAGGTVRLPKEGAKVLIEYMNRWEPSTRYTTCPDGDKVIFKLNQ